jgi:hypothetical protein
LYADEATPGNVHRPDKGRKFMAVYWTFREFPDWFRNGPAGWFPLSFVHHKVMDTIPGGLSGLMVVILRLFFGGASAHRVTGSAGSRASSFFRGDLDCTFQGTGITLSRQASAPQERSVVFTMKATFGCFLCDEQAHNGIAGSKGASGSKPCHRCRNVMGRVAHVPATSMCVHYTCADPTKFIPHTAATLQDAMKELRSAKATGSAGAFKKLQQDLGFNFDENTLLCSDMAAIADLPLSSFWDWMHCIVASGGIAQYELNQFVLRIERIREEWLSRIEEIANVVLTWPKEQKKPRKLRLKDRLRRAADQPIRMFASEMLQWIEVVGVFVEVELKPEGHLPEESACFELLLRICYLLRRGDEAVRKVALLKSLVLEHHRRFMALYPGCGKPKTHFTLHVPECIEDWKINLSCFSPERLHKFTKHIAAHSFRSLTKCLLTRCLIALEDKLCLPETTSAFSLGEPALPVTEDWWFLLEAAGAAPARGEHARKRLASEIQSGRPEYCMLAPKSAKQLRCPVGRLCTYDLLLWESNGVLNAGIAIAFFEAWGGRRWLAGVNILKHEGGCKYSNTLQTKYLVDAQRLLGSYPHIAHKQYYFVVGSNDLLG